MPARSYRLEIHVDEDGNLVGSLPDEFGVGPSARSRDELERRLDGELTDRPRPTGEPRRRGGFVSTDSGFD